MWIGDDKDQARTLWKRGNVVQAEDGHRVLPPFSLTSATS